MIGYRRGAEKYGLFSCPLEKILDPLRFVLSFVVQELDGRDEPKIELLADF